MSKLFGTIGQIGYVVDDIEAAMQAWLASGVGPWFHIARVEVERFRYRGAASSAAFSVALANSGDLQIELIQRLDDEPSSWREFAERGGRGIQHVSYWTRDYDRVHAAAIEAGHVIVQDGEIGGPAGRFCYFESAGNPGTVIELSDISGPKGRIFEQIRQAAVDWDGRDPIRRT